MRHCRLLVLWAALFLLGGCSKDEGENDSLIFSQISAVTVYPTALDLSFLVDSNSNTIVEKGVQVSEDSTKFGDVIWDKNMSRLSKVGILAKKLKPQTPYFFRVVLKDDKGVQRIGQIFKVTTSAASAPSISTDSFSIDGDYNATLQGIVISDGGAPIEEAGFIVGKNTYKVNPILLQGDTLRAILHKVNVKIVYQFYVRNKYGTTTGVVKASENYYLDKFPSCIDYTVNATSTGIFASSLFVFHGNSMRVLHFLISDKPIVKLADDMADVNGKFPVNGWWGWGCTISVSTEPVEIGYHYSNNPKVFSPNTAYYVRMVAEWKDGAPGVWVRRYFWTDEKKVVTPSVIVLDRPKGPSSERKLMQQVG